MQPQIHICPRCRTQHDSDAQFCPSCGTSLIWQPFPPPKRSGLSPTTSNQLKFFAVVIAVILGGYALIGKSPKVEPSASLSSVATSPTTTPTALSTSLERMVLDDAQVTAYVERTHPEYKQYKFRFVVKKPGSPLIAPIVRMAGASNVYSVFVNGVDSDMVGFAFGPNIVVINKNLEVVPATYDTRVLNGNDALGDAYHGLVLKYERGN